MARRDKYGWAEGEGGTLVQTVQVAGYLVTGVISAGRTQLGLAFCSPSDRAKGLFSQAEGIKRAQGRIDKGECYYIPGVMTLRQHVAEAVLGYPHSTGIPEYIRVQVLAGVEALVRSVPPRRQSKPEVALLTVAVKLNPGEKGAIKKQLKAAMRLVLVERTPEAMAKKFKAMLATITERKSADTPDSAVQAPAEPPKLEGASELQEF